VIDLRLRTKISPQELEQKKGKLVTDEDYNVLLTRAVKIRKPDGKPLAIYLPGGVGPEMEEAYPMLRKIKMQSDNRGLASGTVRVNAGGNRTRAMPVHSGIMGAMDPVPNRPVCRLTAFTREHVEAWTGTFPLLRRIAAQFAAHVPDRFAAQKARAEQTHHDWVVPGTPFTTITINNTYATGVHTDAGDLDEGFSCIAVGRAGHFSGGRLVFPEYRVAVDMQHGDLLLMDAHEWHGNTRLTKHSEDAERVSVVAYYRTQMAACGSADDEDRKRQAWAERRVAAKA
jgi:hypothetical protein